MHYTFQNCNQQGRHKRKKYLLLTTTTNKYNAQLEVNRLLTKHFNNINVARRSPIRRSVPIVKNHFSTYVEALVKSPPPTPENHPMITSPSPTQKRKVTSDSNFLLTSTTNESTIAPVTLDRRGKSNVRIN